MLVFVSRAAQLFVQFCNIRIPLTRGNSIPVYAFFAAVLGMTLAFKFIRGLFG